MRRISILNFKGGTGKTSLSTNLAYALTLRGKRVLLVDCDRQGNASSLLPERRIPTLTHVLKGEAPLFDAMQQARENLYIIPADKNLTSAAKHITTTGLRAYTTLKNATVHLDGYDFILYDHSPSYSAITETAILATDEMLIPCELAPYAVEGLLEMINTLSESLNGLDHEVSMIGIVPFKLDHRYSMTEKYLASLKNRFGDRVIPPVRTDSTISRAQSLKQTVFEYDPKSKAAEDIMNIARLLAPEEVSA
jgi:chromosome partitioning protein